MSWVLRCFAFGKWPQPANELKADERPWQMSSELTGVPGKRPQANELRADERRVASNLDK